MRPVSGGLLPRRLRPPPPAAEPPALTLLSQWVQFPKELCSPAPLGPPSFVVPGEIWTEDLDPCQVTICPERLIFLCFVVSMLRYLY